MAPTTTATATLDEAHVGPMDNVAYAVRCRSTGRRLLVDAAAEPETLLALVDGELDVVVTTHRHHDHVGALAAVVEATGARTAAGADDADDLPLPVQQRLEHGDVVRVGDVLLEVVHLRGHTPGSVALLLRDPDGPDHVFTGDSLFPGGVGNTSGDPERFTSLLDDVTARLFDVLDDDTVVHPGHGAPTTLGAERPHLDEWRARGW
ncbi:MBL fold metallo-hydrolase [Kineococcus aurantiacus]|uniref:Glyoxylase-like metal-dependent hydrolase (Beta-lactamase superfamily II) n=1 Tax=Kineococcus aurantiacus TaxID=37633 RepID=A0A7Y9DJC0_9ACTN|nr:MBL fold metallo-hydrolase [Kineococcus aurantiacus]NYD21809.1 glyoxylase-like metal-dependent hydrolase (beta-lactamase superfamily II) [Kineococcus aurantiacus]